MGIVFLEFIGLMLLAALVIGLVSQVAIPFVRGTPFFPNFRKNSPIKEKVLAARYELEDATEEAELQEELNEINRRKAQLKGNE